MKPFSAVNSLALAIALLPSPAPLLAQDALQEFISHFHDEANVPNYVNSVDQLIDAGEAKIYASEEAEREDEQKPSATTENGIFMLYTLTHTSAGVLVHFSTSRAPYLPTALGEHIVGLFMARSGWPRPSHYSVSENQVFHAIWLIPEDEFSRIRPQLPELRSRIRSSEDAASAFLRGALRAGELEEAAGQPEETTGASPDRL